MAGVDPTIPGVNRVITQPQTYTFRYRAESAAGKTTRILISYTVRTAGPN
jgi:hypothetical protein